MLLFLRQTHGCFHSFPLLSSARWKTLLLERLCVVSSYLAYKALVLAKVLCVPVVGARPGLARAPGKGRGDAESCCALGTSLGSGYVEVWKIPKTV